MKKTVICNIPFLKNLTPQVYVSEDASLPSSEEPYCYPINAYFEKVLTPEDELNIIMLTKVEPFGNFKNNMELFMEETKKVCAMTGARCAFQEVRTEFSEDVETHKLLLSGLIDALEPDSSIICDITFGSKDVPILVFNALTFAEKFLGCEIENILYGQAIFKDHEIVSAHLRDLSSLYYLNGVTESLPQVEAGKAKELFKAMLSL